MALPPVLGVLVLLAALSGPAQSLKSVTLAWDPSPNAAGYKLYYGVASRVYTNSVLTGPQTMATVSNLRPGTTYYFSLTALSGAGWESGFSDEIRYTVQQPQPELRFAITESRLRLSSTGQAGHTYEILATRQFTAWQAIGRVTAGPGGAIGFVVPVVKSDSGRFFCLHDVTGTGAGTVPVLRIRWLPDRRLLLEVTGQAGHTYNIESSVDGAPWKAIGAVVVGLGGGSSFIVPVKADAYAGLFRLHDVTYSAPNWPARLSLSLSAARRPLVAGVGTVGGTYDLLASQDMTNWTPIARVSPEASGDFQFADPRPATDTFRCYRLRQIDP